MRELILSLFICSCFALCFFSCTPSRYAVANANNLSAQSGENWQINYIPVPNEYMGSGVLRLTQMYLLASDFNGLRVALDSAERKDGPSSEVYLARSIYNLCRKKYEKGSEQLKLVTDERYAMLRQLLTIDFNYETSRKKGFASFNSFLNEYQKLADQYINHEYMIKLIKVRVRHIRYNTQE